MSQLTMGAGASRVETPPPAPENASTGQLIGQLSDQLTTLVRDEIRLAQVEVGAKAKKFGLGAGLFGGAGLLGFLGLQVLVAAAVLALALALPGWLAAVIVAVVLFAVAGVLALIGKKDVQQAAPPVPTEAISSIKTDVATVKESASR
ncbi:phage holin family protein [Modestobacter sp. VKM Ac-2985]|uniref:phage holin family protein n=1 Tax=Modestobacter sp. VKM Ac-2985 TaxID=3004139 RepID=UPI0022AB9D30|nr:phage holin family protein [Modestobacter sp. VKM Ac-2985]MCZ2837264.1 phage holin family protein [Modestobacter sp. VKM Ac-2985]